MKISNGLTLFNKLLAHPVYTPWHTQYVVAMVPKVQKLLNSLRTADPFETWHKNRSSLTVVLFVLKIFKMAANIKFLKNR
jgi:hypothetical protein